MALEIGSLKIPTPLFETKKDEFERKLKPIYDGFISGHFDLFFGQIEHILVSDFFSFREERRSVKKLEQVL